MQGTLDVLILRTLLFGPQHGQGIARAIQQTSDGELLVEHGALYPALQRLEEKGWITAKWGTSSNNRKARFYSLTKRRPRSARRGSRRSWRRLAAAMSRVLGPERSKGDVDVPSAPHARGLRRRGPGASRSRNRSPRRRRHGAATRARPRRDGDVRQRRARRRNASTKRAAGPGSSSSVQDCDTPGEPCATTRPFSRPRC